MSRENNPVIQGKFNRRDNGGKITPSSGGGDDNGGDDMDARISKLETDMIRLESKVDSGFDRLDAKFEKALARMDVGFAQVDAKFSQVDAKISKSESTMVKWFVGTFLATISAVSAIVALIGAGAGSPPVQQAPQPIIIQVPSMAQPSAPNETPQTK